jgi:hypothetical protein
MVVGGQRVLQPRPALAEVAADVPEAGQRAGQPQQSFRVVQLAKPVQGRSEVVVLALEPFEPGCLRRSGQLGLGALGQLQAPGGVPLASSLGRAAAL